LQLLLLLQLQVSSDNSDVTSQLSALNICHPSPQAEDLLLSLHLSLMPRRRRKTEDPRLNKPGISH